MNIMSRFLRRGFNDEQLEFHAENAIAEDPMINDPTRYSVFSEKGIVTITGNVHLNRERDYVENVIRSAYGTVGLKHDQIVNQLEVQ